MKTDAELLSEYHRRTDQQAFRTLVDRYAGLVRGAAFRSLGNAEDARDVSQKVFVLLAKNAARLARLQNPNLVGWLHRTTVLSCSNARRGERRRQKLMSGYQQHSEIAATEASSRWSDALPVIDVGISQLGEKDRLVLVAHFLEGKSYQEIAASTTDTEAAVQKRGSRALQRLADWLQRKKVVISKSGLACGMVEAGLEPLPVGYAGALTSAVMQSAAKMGTWQVWKFRGEEMLRFGS